MFEYQATILIVDDTPANLNFLLTDLQNKNFRVLVAENGTSALQRLRHVIPDIILLDIVMPDMDGFEVCRLIKTNPKTSHIPVIFLSALNQVVDKVRGFQVGGVDYITKPLRVEEVGVRINTHLTIRQLQNRIEKQNELLEERVQQRTLQLTRINVQLQQEIEQNKRLLVEKEKLYQAVRQHGEQLQVLSQSFLTIQQDRRQTLAHALGSQVNQNLTLLDFHLNSLKSPLSDANLSRHLQEASLLLQKTKEHLQTITSSIQVISVDEQGLQNNPLLILTTREREVLQLVIDGLPSTEIAQVLSLSEGTIRTYRSRIMKKLKVNNLAELVKFVVQQTISFPPKNK